jgi:glycosyltransferase involved in cell wall biosynthesis
MAKLKLGIINSSPLSTSYGGVGPFIKNLDPFLQDAFDVTYVSLPDSLHDSKIIPRRLMFLAYLFRNKKKFNQYDVILSHVPEGSFALSYTKVPLVHIFHGNFNPMSQSRYWFGKYFKFIFQSFENRIIKKAKLKYTVGIERPGIPKIFNPIHHSVAVKNTSTRSGFIFSGRLEKIKNIDRLIRIYSQLSPAIQAENPLYIAGMGTQEIILKDLVKELNLDGKVIFLGNLPNDQLIEADSTKKILVMASSQEGLPMAIAEALSVGIPVISTDTGDIKRILKSNENGFLLPLEFDDKEYVRSIETILADYNRFSQNALESSRLFQAGSIARDLITDINNVVASK